MHKRIITVAIAASIFWAGCASTTTIHSNPAGAKLYLNGEPVGKTPYTHRDKRIVGSSTVVKLEKEGYETHYSSFSRDEELDVWATIGGLLVILPFLWILKYKPIHNYELKPLSSREEPVSNPKTTQSPTRSKADRLLELKQLLDDKIITQEEYEKAKWKILEEN